jgi:hypothetical protein
LPTSYGSSSASIISIHPGKIGIQLIYWFTVGGFGFWAFIDLFRIPRMIERKNEDILRELMAQYRAIGVR